MPKLCPSVLARWASLTRHSGKVFPSGQWHMHVWAGARLGVEGGGKLPPSVPIELVSNQLTIKLFILQLRDTTLLVKTYAKTCTGVWSHVEHNNTSLFETFILQIVPHYSLLLYFWVVKALVQSLNNYWPLRRGDYYDDVILLFSLVSPKFVSRWWGSVEGEIGWERIGKQHYWVAILVM